MSSEIGHLIKQARTEKNMTQAELANKIGLATVTIRQYENGARNPSIDILRKISVALGVSIYSLVDFEDASSLIETSINETQLQYGANWKQFERVRRAFVDLNYKGAERVAQVAEDIAKIPEYQDTEKIESREKENARVVKFWKENVDPDYEE